MLVTKTNVENDMKLDIQLMLGRKSVNKKIDKQVVRIYQFFDSSDEKFDTYASDIYVRNKVNRVKEQIPNLKSIDVIKKDLVECDNLDKLIEELYVPNSFGIIQLPVPEKLYNLIYKATGIIEDEASIIFLNDKLNTDDGDIDCMSYKNIGKFFINPKGEINNLSPCTVGSVYDFLSNIAFEEDEQYLDNDYGDGKVAVVIGRSNIVGKPVAALLTSLNFTVIHCHSKTNPEFLKRMCREADLIVSAVGKSNFITTDMISRVRKQIIIDVGINRNSEGKVCGDVDPTLYKPEFSNLIITKVPGSIGFGTTMRFTRNIAYLLTKK